MRYILPAKFPENVYNFQQRFISTCYGKIFFTGVVEMTTSFFPTILTILYNQITLLRLNNFDYLYPKIMLGEHQSILITGGSGFIGSHLLHILVKDYPETEFYNLDALTYASDNSRLESLTSHNNYHFIKADLRDAKAIMEIFQTLKIDGVFHLAAESHVDNSINNPTIFFETNVMGTANLLEAARQIWAPQREFHSSGLCLGGVPRFLHVSTDEVYGSLKLGESTLFNEETAYNPSSPYSASKAASDHLVNSYHHTFGLSTVITNCSNNFGPWQHREKLIPTVINSLKTGQPVPIYGKGENVRDWLYVTDHCYALIEVFLKGRSGEKYNIGARNELTNLEIVKHICEIMETLLPIKNNRSVKVNKYSDLISYVQDRPGHDARYAIDNAKITLELGWQPQHSFHEALVKTVQSYL